MPRFHVVPLKDRWLFLTNPTGYRRVSDRSLAIVNSLVAACSLPGLPEETSTALEKLLERVNYAINDGTTENSTEWESLMERIKLLVPKHVLHLCLTNGHPVLSPLPPFLVSRLMEAYESLDIEQDWNLEIGECLGRVVGAVLEGVVHNSDRWYELRVDTEMHTSRLLNWCITAATFSYQSRVFVHTLVELRHQPIFTGDQHVLVESCFCRALHVALQQVTEQSKEWRKVAMDITDTMSKILKAHITADYWRLSQDSKDLVRALATVSSQSSYGRADLGSMQVCVGRAVSLVLGRVSEESEEWRVLLYEIPRHLTMATIACLATDYCGIPGKFRYAVCKLMLAFALLATRGGGPAPIRRCLVKLVRIIFEQARMDFTQWREFEHEIAIHSGETLDLCLSDGYPGLPLVTKRIIRDLLLAGSPRDLPKDRRDMIVLHLKKSVKAILDEVSENSKEWQSILEESEVILAANCLMTFA